jgi:hypothetical protein
VTQIDKLNRIVRAYIDQHTGGLPYTNLTDDLAPADEQQA